MGDASVPGWYGKLPTLGDFASRRLAPDWIAAWDDWLAQGLAQLRERQGEAWIEGYLASPPWRFVLLPGVQPGLDGAWAGVLMASVDRVGRYFPLTLAAPLAHVPESAAALDALLGWLHRLEDVAVDALQDDWDIERLEAELAGLPVPQVEPLAADGDASVATLLGAALDGGDGGFATAPSARAELVATLCGAIGRRGRTALQGASFWLAGSETPPRFAVLRALPGIHHFDTLFGAAAAPAS